MQTAHAHLRRRLACGLPILFGAIGCAGQHTLAPPDSRAGILEAHEGAVSASVILRGAIITPNGVLKHGYLGITEGRIAAVSEKQPNIPGAKVVNTDGILLPGLVDIHNPVPWNVLPRWHPGQTFANWYQWRVDPGYLQAAGQSFDHLVDSHFCDERLG